MTEYSDETSDKTMPPNGARGTYNGFSMRFNAKSGEWVANDTRQISIVLRWDSKEAEKVEWDPNQTIAQESGCEHGVRPADDEPILRARGVMEVVDADAAEDKCAPTIGTLEIPARGREIS